MPARPVPRRTGDGVIPLSIPELVPDTDMLTSAMAYAKAGWYVVPVRAGTKNPGSVLGQDWQLQSSRDPQQITAWLAGTDHGIALHVGRSGAVAFDVDHPEKLPAVLAHPITGAPFQATRADDRGHAVFAVPDGRVLGNSTGKLGGEWGQVRGRNGVVMVTPSVHPDGGRYRWLRTGAVPELPAAIAELLPDTTHAEDAATDAEVSAFLKTHQDASRPELLAAVLATFERDVSKGGSRHESAVRAACWAMREAQAGVYSAKKAADDLRQRFIASLNGESDRYPAPEFAGILAWAIGQAATDDPVVRRRAVDERVPYIRALVAEHMAQLRTWQHLPDAVPVLATLAVAVTAEDTEGEPAWLLAVAPPSSGKTEMVSMLGDVERAHLGNVTSAGLLTWSRGKAPKPTGLLTRVTHGLVTFGDLSTLLATSDRGGRDEVFALLRTVYDGKVSRDIGSGGNDPLHWSGRMNIVGAVTGAIDSYAVHAAQLGARWLYVRLPERDTAAKRAAAVLARRGRLAENRANARKSAAQIVRTARPRLPQVEVTGDLAAAIEDAALVCCWGRAAVPRHGYGAREIDGIATIEEPPRLVRQLTTLARGLLAMGTTADDTATICRRIALDSMPADRFAVLAMLAARADNVRTTAEIANAARLHRHVARRALEELEVVRVVRAVRDGDVPAESEPDRRTCRWFLDGTDGDLIAEMFNLSTTPTHS